MVQKVTQTTQKQGLLRIILYTTVHYHWIREVQRMVNDADKKTISWNQMFENVCEVIRSAEKQMAQQRQLAIDTVVEMIDKFDITLSEINETSKQMRGE